MTAIDDFGAGHAGLGLLANLQTDMIKIHMHLVRAIDRSLPRRQIVAGLVKLCHDMDITLVAEGVETAAELDVLAGLGIRYVQGFLFSRPEIGTLPVVVVPATQSTMAA